MRIFAKLLLTVMMRIRFILAMLLAAVMFMPLNLLSQEKQKKEKKKGGNDFLSLEFNMNYSIVMGNYGANDKSNDKAGYAKNGWGGALTLNWLGKNGFGLAFQYDLQHNPYQDIAATTNPYGTKYVLGTNGWYNNYLMAGPVFIRDFGKIELNVKALVGFILSTSTNFNVMSPVDTSNVSLTGSGFGYAVNLAVGYRISRHWGVNLQLGYLGGTPKAKKTFGQELLYRSEYDSIRNIWVSVPYYSNATTKEIKKVVSTFNGGIGVIYHF
jgi:hypothetical protein